VKANIIKGVIKAVLYASEEACLGARAEKTKYRPVFMSRHQIAKQNHYVKVADKSLESVVKLKYLGTAVTNQTAFIKELIVD
jgi:hypothetical protein